MVFNFRAEQGPLDLVEAFILPSSCGRPSGDDVRARVSAAFLFDLPGMGAMIQEWASFRTSAVACQDQRIAQVLATCLAMILISLVVTSDPVSVDACTRVCRSSVPHDVTVTG